MFILIHQDNRATIGYLDLYSSFWLVQLSQLLWERNIQWETLPSSSPTAIMNDVDSHQVVQES